MTLTLQELAQLCDTTSIQGNAQTLITSAADIKSAGSQQLTVLSDARYAQFLPTCQAAACIVKHDAVPTEVPAHLSLLLCADPELSFIKAVQVLHPERRYMPYIAPQTAIAPSAQLAANVHVGAFSTIGEDSIIGEGCVILSNVTIGNYVKLGRNCCLHPQVVLYDYTEIGDNVIIHAGSVIGADGFGYKNRQEKHIKVPHVGNVVIHDNVEIGANTCIDRGAFGATVIGAGTKIDNIVQIGHNNVIGKNVIICGQSGISGSCTIEDGAILAGSAGIADHVTIGHHAVVMARSGISHDVKPGTQVFGSPAKDKKVAWQELAALSKLPALLKQIKVLEKRLQELETQAASKTP